jgi:hypothetical protein
VRVTDDSGATATASQALAVGYGSLALRTLDATLGSGPYVNLATADGKLCAAYELGGDLAFVRATTASADAFTPPAMLGELDYGLSLASLGDRLAIAYNSGDKLEFRRANDSAASSWHPAVTVMQSATNKPGAYPALALINGKPAVTGTDSAQLVSWYARAKDSVGDQWHARTVLNSSQKGINGGLIALASGRPAAATVKYQNISQVGVMFCASEDAAGLDWLDPLTVHNSGDFLAYSGGLCLAAGRPALTFHDQTTNKVRFQRAKDAEGAEWNNALAVVTLDLGAKPSTSYLSMATVSGLPAIAYLDGALGLRLVVAKTAVGAAWNPPLTVDAAATGAQWVTLAEFAGRPAIAYADPDGLRLALWH